ncbi:MAG TPA: glycoside hydrolase domain-containing protein [Planctomycetota bacterium]|nr:glycoside hydrolase domain-containing protein [Planctomycetota bacterium]
MKWIRVLSLLSWLTGGAHAADTGPPLLGTQSQWRCFFVWQEELVQWESGELTRFRSVKGAPKPIEKVDGKPEASAAAPGGWTAAEFDDSSWACSPGPIVHTPHRRDLAAILLRGKFELAEPADLTLALSWRGGAIVYLNGKELVRANLPAGAIAPGAPGEPYPKAAYVDAEGKLLFAPPREAEPEGMKLRVRTLSHKVPASAVRQGLNVLAVELHRAPTSELLYTAVVPKTPRGDKPQWSMVGLEELSLGGGKGPQASLAVWPGNPLLDVFDADPGEPGMAGKPVRLAGARNGAFSGVVMVRSPEAVKGLKVEPGALKLADGDAVIPASAWRVRFAVPGDAPPVGAASRRPQGAAFLGVLAEAPPENAAAVPVWLTVRVGGDAKPGEYKGVLRVSVNAAAPAEVPVELSVADFALPEPRSYTCFTGIAESPESVALQYGVPLWSEEHWKLLDRVFAHLGQVGVRMVLIPVVAKTHRGNDQSMVRWVKQADGSLKPDFGVVERYLDLVAKHLGTGPLVCWYVWMPSQGGGAWGATPDKPKNEKPTPITVLDPATGQAQDGEAPDWGTPQSVPFWKPVFDGLRERLAKRGLEKSAALGLVCDFTPSKQTVEDLRAVAPELRWVVHAHGLTLKFAGQPVAEAAHVWGVKEPRTSDDKLKRYGWKNAIITTVFPRYGAGSMGHVNPTSPVGVYHALLEGYQASGYDGVNDLGADFWPVVKMQRRELLPLSARYGYRDRPGSPPMTHGSLLFPAKDGPVATVRFEVLRLGVQEAEARIFIEKALEEPAKRAKLGDELAARAQGLLDERVRKIANAKLDRSPMFSYGSDASWLDYAAGVAERARALYHVAAQVSNRLSK